MVWGLIVIILLFLHFQNFLILFIQICTPIWAHRKVIFVFLHLFTFFFLFGIILPICVMGMGYSPGQIFPRGCIFYSILEIECLKTKWLEIKWLKIEQLVLWLCGGLFCSLYFFGLHCGKPISPHEFRMVSHIYLSGHREFVYIGSGESNQLTCSCRCGLRSGLVWPVRKRGGDGLFLPEVLHLLSLQIWEGLYLGSPRTTLVPPENFCLFYMYGFLIGCGLLYPHWLCPPEDCMRRIHIGSCSLVLICKPFLEVYLFISYAVSRGLLDAKVNQVISCFNIIWKSKGSLLTMWLILNLSLNFIVTDVGKFILFPFKVMLTSFQFNSVMSQSIFIFIFTFSGVNVP